MSNIFLNIRRIGLLFLCAAAIGILAGCGSKTSGGPSGQSTETKAPRDHLPVVLEPVTTGEVLYSNELVSLDGSGASAGHVVLTYHGTNEKVKFQILAPDGVKYTYPVSSYGTAMVFPLSGGNGTYLFSLFESVDISRDLYATSFSQEIEVLITDEFLPYLTPNVYANFHASSLCVEKASSLAEGCFSDLEVIGQIYHYVIENIVYDQEKATNVVYGYLPDPDATLTSGNGICFDYASLMTSMLRSQRIPTKLEVGYVQEVYHAWISCYVDEIGWVDNIIQFDGSSWSLMDPTLAADNSSGAVQEFIGDGSNYLVKYTY